MSEPDPLLGRLLAGKDTPSVLEREALWARIESDLEPEVQTARAPWLFRWLPIFGGGLAVAAMVLVLVLPKDEFTARGGDAPTVRISCVDACVPGATLVLDVQAPKARPNVAAYLESTSEIVWLIPTASDKSGPLERARGFKIPAGFNTESAKVVVVFSETPLERKVIGEKIEAG